VLLGGANPPQKRLNTSTGRIFIPNAIPHDELPTDHLSSLSFLQALPTPDTIRTQADKAGPAHRVAAAPFLARG
jgi:hypothetical protein